MQLNVREHYDKPSFYETIAKIMAIRAKYIRDRHIFVESSDMIQICRGLGARDEDFRSIANVGDNLYSDPTLPFRKSRNGRFCMDFETKSLRRLEFQPFVLSAAENFQRHDSGQLRRFDEIQDDLQLNSVAQALFIFKAAVINGVETAPRPHFEYVNHKWVCTLFCLRTITNKSILGEPALEGVHSDGVDHTMTTFLGSKNMRHDSAITYLHSMRETTGKPLGEISPENLLGCVQHRGLLDTLLVADNERKHSLSPVHIAQDHAEASRDMLIFFTRRPVSKQHISASYDSLAAHKKLAMEVPLFSLG